VGKTYSSSGAQKGNIRENAWLRVCKLSNPNESGAAKDREKMQEGIFRREEAPLLEERDWGENAWLRVRKTFKP
jgi:tRNA(Glu) U13 pseudouridine synthase TruD